MPIVEVELIGAEPPAGECAARLAEALGAVFDSAAMRCWVKLRHSPAEDYAENGGGPPAGVWPVFVSVLLAELPPLEKRRDQAVELARAVAEVVGRDPAQIHVLYLPSAAGRIAFGGRLLEE